MVEKTPSFNYAYNPQQTHHRTIKFFCLEMEHLMFGSFWIFPPTRQLDAVKPKIERIRIVNPKTCCVEIDKFLVEKDGERSFSHTGVAG